MIITALAFKVFSRLFEGHADLILGLAINHNGTISVLLDYQHYSWRVSRGIKGEVIIQYTEGTAWCDVGSIYPAEFGEVTLV